MPTMTFMQPTPTLVRDGDAVVILDQRRLPFLTERCRLESLEAVATAITTMQVRGAPLIGATAAFGVAIALHTDASDTRLAHALATLAGTRPTAVNLHWALGRMRERLEGLSEDFRHEAAWEEAQAIARSDFETCAAIGHFGVELLQNLAQRRSGPVRVMTHCNAGWLATMGAGTALAPVYEAMARDIPVHVLVSETRPRNQGLLTQWELARAGVPHTLIADNAAGLLIARTEVDIVITGADRVAANGDTANKIGTYLKALAAFDHDVPFYIAAPLSTVDFSCRAGEEIPIEERDGDEVLTFTGMDERGQPGRLRLAPAATRVANPAFDITPARLISGIITEYGICAATALDSLRTNPPV